MMQLHIHTLIKDRLVKPPLKITLYVISNELNHYLPFENHTKLQNHTIVTELSK